MKRVLTGIAAPAAALGFALAAPTAAAVSGSQYNIPYIFGGAEFVSSDDVRDSDDGFGGRFGIGIPLFNSRSQALELSFYNNRIERESDGANDYQQGFFADYVYNLKLGPFKPYGLVGLGASEDDILGNNDLHLGVNVGIGSHITLFRGLGLRNEVRYVGQFNSEHYADEDFVGDVRFNVGLTLPLTRYFEDRGSSPARRDCALTVVDPATGRTDCIEDSDVDGVRNIDDLCPNTVPGVPVDSRGCAFAQSDSDADGVADRFDACPATPAGVPVDETGCQERQVIVLRGVNFETASATLKPGSKSVLDGVVDTLNSRPGALVEIAGHTDAQGDAEFNLALSQRRAESVLSYLVSKGVDGGRLVARGYGEYEPVASNDTASGRAENRRVEFRILSR